VSNASAGRTLAPKPRQATHGLPIVPPSHTAVRMRNDHEEMLPWGIYDARSTEVRPTRDGSLFGGRRSGVLPSNSIVNGVPKPLLAPEIALRGLDRCVAEQELDLLQLAAREMA